MGVSGATSTSAGFRRALRNAVKDIENKPNEIGEWMTIKDLGIREWLVIAFISIGLLAFVFEDKFKPKIYEAEGTGIGYAGDITLKVKLTRKR